MTAPDPADVAEFRKQLRIHGIERTQPEAAAALAQALAVIDAAAPVRAAAHVPTAVAETLRYISQWGDDALEADGLRGVAADVDSLAKEPAGWTCCPVCQEITCDTDCPLSTVRAALIGDSQ